jgi:hypothetical protein
MEKYFKHSEALSKQLPENIKLPQNHPDKSYVEAFTRAFILVLFADFTNAIVSFLMKIVSLENYNLPQVDFKVRLNVCLVSKILDKGDQEKYFQSDMDLQKFLFNVLLSPSCINIEKQIINLHGAIGHALSESWDPDNHKGDQYILPRFKALKGECGKWKHANGEAVQNFVRLRGQIAHGNFPKYLSKTVLGRSLQDIKDAFSSFCYHISVALPRHIEPDSAGKLKELFKGFDI